MLMSKKQTNKEASACILLPYCVRIHLIWSSSRCEISFIICCLSATIRQFSVYLVDANIAHNFIAGHSAHTRSKRQRNKNKMPPNKLNTSSLFIAKLVWDWHNLCLSLSRASTTPGLQIRQSKQWLCADAYRQTKFECARDQIARWITRSRSN